MDGVGIVEAELVDNLRNPLVVTSIEGVANKALELEGTTLAFIVELVVQGFSDIGVHDDVVAAKQRLAWWGKQGSK